MVSPNSSITDSSEFRPDSSASPRPSTGIATSDSAAIDSHRVPDSGMPPLSSVTDFLAGSLVSQAFSMGFVPSLPAMFTPPASEAVADPLLLQPGQAIDDYHVIAILGRGAFGAVYLSWQMSLGRQVAIKISPRVGEEGRTLARLDHPHIVRVYSEKVHQGMRLLCMQYVPSMALDDLLKQLRDSEVEWTGRDLLELVDRGHSIPTELDPEQLVDRQKLSELGHVDAVCWIIARLADALGHAHRHHVLHRDLKPGNVLISQYGRPMLVDFNLANVVQQVPDDSQIFGGTLPYMSPEHLDAFNPEHPTGHAAVTKQSDVYSLGVMMFELLTGRLPFESSQTHRADSQWLHTQAEIRRHPEPLWNTEELASEPAVCTVLQRCLAPASKDRWESADQLSRALTETIELRKAVAKVARRSRLPQWSYDHPFLMLLLLGLTPHLIGSLFNIPYNLTRIVGPARQPTFFKLVNVYNVLVYPGCVLLCLSLIVPVVRLWRSRGTATPDEITHIRELVLSWPWWAVWVALLGWMPGAFFFPAGLHLWAGPLTWGEVFHFQLSVLLSGLIALTYSALGTLFVTMCLLYPRLWVDPQGFRQRAAHEVRSLNLLVKMIPPLAGAIPLLGAILLVGSSPKSFGSDGEYMTFRVLSVGLIAVGMGGFQLAVMITDRAARAIRAFRGRVSEEGD